MPSYLTPKQVAEETQLAYRTVLKEIHEGRLRASRLGRQIRVAEVDFDAWVEQSAVTPQPAPSARGEWTRRPGAMKKALGILRA